MGYLKAALYLDVILTLTLIILFTALGSIDSMISLLPVLLALGVASGPTMMFISWVYASAWSQ